MNRKQRKAKLAKAKQHQEYAASPEYQEIRSKKWTEDYERYNREYERHDAECLREMRDLNRLTPKRIFILVVLWVAVVLGLAWISTL
jgi:hypothetical protein